MAQAPLNEAQKRAASLLGRGWTHKAVAAEVGTSTRSIRRWSDREDFAALVARGREAALAVTPDAKKALKDALLATKADGTPDHKIRVTAARALLGLDAATADPDPPSRETVIVTEHLDGESD